MTKKTFLKKLETKLSNLDEKKRAAVLRKYENIIDKEVNAGKDIKDVITSFGDVDMIAKLYAEVEQEEKEEPKTAHKEGTAQINNAIDSFFRFIDDAFKNIDGELAKRILVILCFVFIGIIGLSILHIPFRIMDGVGSGIFSVVFDNYSFYHFVSITWSVSLGICYAILVIWLIVHYVNKIVGRYSGKDFHEYVKNSATGTFERKVESEKKADNIAVRDSSPLDIVYIILKVFIIILTIPFLMMIAGLFIALFFVISLIFSGVTLYGPAIFLIGLITITGALLNLIYTSLSKGGIR